MFKCTRCGIAKPAGDFYESKGKRQSQCKSCFRERYYEPVRSRKIAYATEYKRRVLGRPGVRTIVCRVCGTTFTSPKRTTVFCSRPCKYAATHEVLKAERLAAKPAHRSCVNCGIDFPPTMRADAKFCSARCNDAAHAIVRKMAKRARSVAPRGITKAVIGNRDGWLCGLCVGTVDKTKTHPDPLCPSIDHIVPLSLGGTNAVENLQISHLVCNLRKRDRTLGLHPPYRI